MDIFSRTQLLLGDDAMSRLKTAHAAVFGLGGVGGYVCEALARSGVGTLSLFDHDRVSATNINRQIVALHSTLGMEKTEAMRLRLLDINPQLSVITHPLFYLPETADNVSLAGYDYIADCVDTVTAKLTLAERAQAARVPIISAMGAGNKLNPAALRVADIYETSVCALSRVMRRACKRRGIESLKVVYSTEEAKRVSVPGEQPAGAPRRDTPGSTIFVPAAMGLMMAAEVVKDITQGGHHAS